MILPQSRLLFWFAVVVLPFSVLGALYAEGFQISLALIIALAALALLDVALAFGCLDGITVVLPEVMRFSKDREGTIEVRLRNERQKQLSLRLGLAFPRELQAACEDVRVSLPAGSEWSRLEWRCTPLKRGNFRLTHAYLETSSPLGFWAVRTATPVKGEVRAYPNLLTERKNLAALFLNRGAFGIHAQRQVGKGRDFEKLREYIPGDSFEDIHWKATAKRGRPVTKVFQIERTQEVYVVIDASRLSAREADPSQLETSDSKPGTSVLERYITSALVLGLAAEQQGDLFGLVTFSDRVENFVRARNGKTHYSACRDAIYTLEPRIATPDFEELASFIRLRLRRRALLIFLTALDDPALAEGFVRAAELLSGQHLMLVNMMKPPGADPLFSQPDVQSVDDLYPQLGGHIRWHNLRELEKKLHRRGVQFATLENEKLSVQLVSQYLGVKQRQLL